MTFRSAVLAAALAVVAPLAGAATASATDYTENFDAVASGTSTTFTDSGITFSSPTAGGFYVGDTAGLFSTLSGNALFSTSTTGSELDIIFAAPVEAVTLNFALADFFGSGGNDVLTFTTNTGASGSDTAALVGGFYPEGVLTYTGPAFSTIDIISATYQLAVDNIVATPEPASLGVLAMGLAGLAAFRRRRA